MTWKYRVAASATNAAKASSACLVFGRGRFVSASQFIEGSQLRIELGLNAAALSWNVRRNEATRAFLPAAVAGKAKASTAMPQGS